VFRWVRDELAAAETETAKRLGIDAYDVLTRIAERVPPGCEGLLFHPFLTGERAPWWNARMRASFFGLAAHHRKEHMIRAVLEGVIFSLHSILPAVEALIGPTRTIKATGGFARSGLWRQMMADVFDREVIVPESFESSCLGAAIMARTRWARWIRSRWSQAWSAPRIGIPRSRNTSPFTGSLRPSSAAFRTSSLPNMRRSPRSSRP
jgi:gluconokinase